MLDILCQAKNTCWKTVRSLEFVGGISVGMHNQNAGQLCMFVVSSRVSWSSVVNACVTRLHVSWQVC